jgi:hypothetical protein
MSMSYWWNDIWQGNPKFSERNPPQCHVFQHEAICNRLGSMQGHCSENTTFWYRMTYIFSFNLVFKVRDQLSPVNYCWPSPAQSFFVSSNIRNHDQICFSLQDCLYVWEWSVLLGERRVWPFWVGATFAVLQFRTSLFALTQISGNGVHILRTRYTRCQFSITNIICARYSYTQEMPMESSASDYVLTYFITPKHQLVMGIAGRLRLRAASLYWF